MTYTQNPDRSLTPPSKTSKQQSSSTTGDLTNIWREANNKKRVKSIHSRYEQCDLKIQKFPTK